MKITNENTNRQEKAINLFRNNYNCSQSVLSVFSEELGVKKDLAMKLASPFGSGIAYMQETCGAVSGALMAIGLKYGKGENGTNEDKARAYDLSQHFMTEFKQLHQTVCCRELLDDINMSTPEGITRIMELDYFRIRCAQYVRDAVQIAETIISKDIPPEK
jgi:C_GCAxxG_C_C family probable redox protein